MKVAKLAKGHELHFPDNTSDDVIKSVVKRVLGVIEKPVESEKPVTEDKFDTLLSTLIEHQKQNFYDDASEKKNKIILDVSTKQNSLLDGFFKMFIKAKNIELDDNQEHVKELAKQIVAIGTQVELLAHIVRESTVALVRAQESNTDAIYKLVEAYKSPRTITRDKDGKPRGIE